MTAALTLPGVEAPDGSAFIDGVYRYWLRDVWDDALLTLLYLMLNPSTATGRRAEHDPTVKKCIRIAKANGYGGIVIVNLFAYRSPYPYDLLRVEDPVGPDNDRAIAEQVAAARTIVCAWGAWSRGEMGRLVKARAIRVLRIIGERPTCALGVTKEGEPMHPLARGKARLADDVRPRSWP